MAEPAVSPAHRRWKTNSFHQKARQARDPNLAIELRLKAFRACVLAYANLIGQPRNPILRRYELFYWVGEKDIPLKVGGAWLHHRQCRDRGLHIHWALSSLETERNAYLQKLLAFQKRRIREKCAGRRQPCRAALAELAKPCIPFPLYYHPDVFSIQPVPILWE